MKFSPIDFLKEFLTRLFGANSPAYFKAWNVINISLFAIGFIPTALNYLEITLPPVHWVAVLLKVCGACGLYGYIMTKQTVERPTVTIGDTVKKADGTILMPTPTPLPFTDKAEAKK